MVILERTYAQLNLDVKKREKQSVRLNRILCRGHWQLCEGTLNHIWTNI